jgi:hypothetical protein
MKSNRRGDGEVSAQVYAGAGEVLGGRLSGRRCTC